MASSRSVVNNKLFNISILCLLLTLAYSYPIINRATSHHSVYRREEECISCSAPDKCPGSAEKVSDVSRFMELLTYIAIYQPTEGLTTGAVQAVQQSCHCRNNCNSPLMVLGTFSHTR